MTTSRPTSKVWEWATAPDAAAPGQIALAQDTVRGGYRDGESPTAGGLNWVLGQNGQWNKFLLSMVRRRQLLNWTSVNIPDLLGWGAGSSVLDVDEVGTYTVVVGRRGTDGRPVAAISSGGGFWKTQAFFDSTEEFPFTCVSIGRSSTFQPSFLVGAEARGASEPCVWIGSVGRSELSYANAHTGPVGVGMHSAFYPSNLPALIGESNNGISAVYSLVSSTDTRTTEYTTEVGATILASVDSGTDTEANSGLIGGGVGSDPVIYRLNSDGTVAKWTTFPTIPGPITSLAWDGEYYLATGNDGAIIHSSDGVNWSTRAVNPFSNTRVGFVAANPLAGGSIHSLGFTGFSRQNLWFESESGAPDMAFLIGANEAGKLPDEAVKLKHPDTRYIALFRDGTVAFSERV